MMQTSLVQQVKLSLTELNRIWTLSKGSYSLVLSDDHQEIARIPLSKYGEQLLRK